MLRYRRKKNHPKITGKYVPVYKNGRLDHLVYISIENLED